MSRIHFFFISAGWDHGELIMWKTTIYSMVYTLLIKKPARSMWKQVWENATQAINTSLPCCWTDKHHWYFLVMTNPTPSHTNFVNYVSFSLVSSLPSEEIWDGKKSGGVGRWVEVWHRVLKCPNWANYHGEATTCDLTAEQSRMESCHHSSTSLQPSKSVTAYWHLKDNSMKIL